MKSERAKKFIDGCMNHLEVNMSDHAKWQLQVAMTHAAKLAEGMKGTVSDYEVASIVKTSIVDAYKIAEK